MSHRPPRLHRLPQRLDWKLVPAPLDISLPLATEKSPLPAIIVTPSSPMEECNSPFYIAFLTPPPKPTLRERFMEATSHLPCPSFLRSSRCIESTSTSTSPFVSMKIRTLLVMFLVFFIVICHLLVHLAFVRPHLEFDFYSAGFAGNYVSNGSESSWWDIFDFTTFWGSGIPGALTGDKRDLLVGNMAHAIA